MNDRANPVVRSPWQTLGPTMLDPSQAAWYSGMGLCLTAGLRCAQGAARWLAAQRADRRHMLEALRRFEEQLAQQPANGAESGTGQERPAWQGYRRFVVDRLVAEASDVTSIYLLPEDRRSLPRFKPGQFLTVRVCVPGHNAPLVRCFSLSDRPGRDYFRLTVKAVALETEKTPARRGTLSRYLNRGLSAGQVIEAQAPRGEFYLRTGDSRPAVLIAAGIGITPLLSMASHSLHESPNRRVILFYGVRNGGEHAFREELSDLAAQHPQLSYLPFYSQPSPGDRAGVDYLAPRRIDAELLRRVLPEANFPCYVCGPGAFMESMTAGLREWGVAETDLHYESFGPSSVRPSPGAERSPAIEAAASAEVVFLPSDVTATWSGEVASLLELAEANGIPLASGCRSGNCGMCAVRLIEGKVKYPQSPSAPIDPGHCLACIAVPESERVVLAE
jgi:uncharacterized protein